MQPICCLDVPLTSLQWWQKAYVAAAIRFPLDVLDSLIRDPVLQVVGEQRINRTPHGEVLISMSYMMSYRWKHVHPQFNNEIITT